MLSTLHVLDGTSSSAVLTSARLAALHVGLNVDLQYASISSWMRLFRRSRWWRLTMQHMLWSWRVQWHGRRIRRLLRCPHSQWRGVNSLQVGLGSGAR